MKYKKSVSKLLADAEANEEVRKRVKGTVEQILGVKKGYELAVERVLGENAQGIVTENIDDARWLIEYIKENVLGLITFYPAKNMRPVVLTEEIPQGKGVRGWLSDFVEYEMQYAGIVFSLLKDTVVCDTLENAVAFMKRETHKYRVVTLSGEMIEKNGRVIGGWL